MSWVHTFHRFDDEAAFNAAAFGEQPNGSGTSLEVIVAGAPTLVRAGWRAAVMPAIFVATLIGRAP